MYKVSYQYQGELTSPPLLVLIHGWGSSHAIWRDVTASLTRHFEVLCIDLPGHGQSHDIACQNLDDLLVSLCQFSEFDEDRPTLLLGWSLGGLVAVKLAEALKRKSDKHTLAIATYGTNLSFVAQGSWSFAMPARTFEAFCKEVSVRENYLKYFYGIQSRGALVEKLERKELQRRFVDTHFCKQQLEVMLAWLNDCVVFSQWRELEVPWMFHIGSFDPFFADPGGEKELLTKRMLDCLLGMTDLPLDKYRNVVFSPNAGHIPMVLQQAHEQTFTEAWVAELVGYAVSALHLATDEKC